MRCCRRLRCCRRCGPLQRAYFTLQSSECYGRQVIEYCDYHVKAEQKDEAGKAAKSEEDIKTWDTEFTKAGGRGGGQTTGGGAGSVCAEIGRGLEAAPCPPPPDPEPCPCRLTKARCSS